MVAKAQSQALKERQRRKEEDEFKMRAAAAYINQELHGGEKKKSARTIAKDFEMIWFSQHGKRLKICYAWIIRRSKNLPTRAQTAINRKWLTEEEEKIVVANIIELANRGWPLSHRRLKEHVDSILRARLGAKSPRKGVGKKWTQRFLRNKSDVLKTAWGTPLEVKRGRAVNKNTLAAWFNLLESTFKEYGIVPETTYAADEIGTNFQAGERERVIGGKGDGLLYQQRDGTREWLSVIVKIGGDGSADRPTVIYKGEEYREEWLQDNPADCS
jgi:hypothetical protein